MANVQQAAQWMSEGKRARPWKDSPWSYTAQDRTAVITSHCQGYDGKSALICPFDLLSDDWEVCDD